MRRAHGRPALPKDHPDSIRGIDQFQALDRNDEADDTAARIMRGIQSEADEIEFRMTGRLARIEDPMIEFYRTGTLTLA